jgi:ATP-dependent DNA ligase
MPGRTRRAVAHAPAQASLANTGAGERHLISDPHELEVGALALLDIRLTADAVQRAAEPMLARSGDLRTRGDFAYEVKWDGFRAIVSTEGPLRVRGRRGWNMIEHVQFVVHLHVRAVLDGELVAFDDEGKPDFPLVCERVSHRHSTISLTSTS